MKNFSENEKELYNIACYFGIFSNIMENYISIIDDFGCDGYIDEIDDIRLNFDVSTNAMNETINKIKTKINDLKEKIKNE